MIIYRCMINVDNKNEQLDILDTAGQEQFAALQDHWIREAEAFVLVYSVTSERTLKHAADLYKKISRNKDGQRIDMILVGNKSDLPMNQHEVTYQMGKQTADSWGVPFKETSAKTGDNVYECFEELIRQVNMKDKPLNGTNDYDQTDITGQGTSCCIIL